MQQLDLSWPVAAWARGDVQSRRACPLVALRAERGYSGRLADDQPRAASLAGFGTANDPELAGACTLEVATTVGADPPVPVDALVTR